MDCLVLGSNGFAQMGDSAFYKKLKIEMQILLDYFHHNFPIMQKFKILAHYSVKTFHALRYIPSPVVAAFMGLPCGIIHHSIRLPTWMPEKISGLRAKRIQRQPPKGFVFAYFFYARSYITLCQVI